MQGLHLTADLYRCRCEPPLLVDATQLAALCRRHTEDAGLTVVDEKWFTFPDHQGQPGGVTGMLLLAESHLAVHTWPERDAVTLDVYVCNFTADNSPKAERLMGLLAATFDAEDAQVNRLWRGEADQTQVPGERVEEALSEDTYYGLSGLRRTLTRKTPYQLLELFESPRLGKILRLDGYFMTSEGEEFFYHEALVHPAAIAHPEPRRVLILGGGDGGAAEEVLKHPSVERVVIAELDAEVVAVAREHLAAIHRGSLDDARVEIAIGDGLAYVRHTAERFDLVLLDLTDPETPAGPLYTESFFRELKGVLEDGSAIVLHLGTPVFEGEQVSRLARELSRVFGRVACYGLYIPLYGAYWGLAVASDELDPRSLAREEVAHRLRRRGISGLAYYNADVHGALFALPNFYRDLVEAPADLKRAAGA